MQSISRTIRIWSRPCRIHVSGLPDAPSCLYPGIGEFPIASSNTRIQPIFQIASVPGCRPRPSLAARHRDGGAQLGISITSYMTMSGLGDDIRLIHGRLGATFFGGLQADACPL